MYTLTIHTILDPIYLSICCVQNNNSTFENILVVFKNFTAMTKKYSMRAPSMGIEWGYMCTCVSIYVLFEHILHLKYNILYIYTNSQEIKE